MPNTRSLLDSLRLLYRGCITIKYVQYEGNLAYYAKSEPFFIEYFTFPYMSSFFGEFSKFQDRNTFTGVQNAEPGYKKETIPKNRLFFAGFPAQAALRLPPR